MASHAPITGAPTRAPSISRRSILSAMAFAPIVATASAVPMGKPLPGRAEWEAAMDTYEKVTADYEADDALYDRVFASSAATAEKQAAWDRNTDLAEQQGIAVDVLVAMPAPDAEALAWKFDYLFSPNRDGSISAWDRDYVNQTLVDALRLARS